MAGKTGRETRRVVRWSWLGLLGLALALVALLGACGGAEVAPTAQVTARPTATATPTTAGANVPPGIGATAQAVAGTVISGAPGAVATAAAVATTVAPTVRAGVSGLVPTAQALATQAAGNGIVPTVQALATQAAGSTGGPEATITGRVTKVDVAARTFTVQSSDGTNYDFIATTSSQVDFTALASNLVSNQQVTITYRNTTSPYEVISVK